MWNLGKLPARAEPLGMPLERYLDKTDLPIPPQRFGSFYHFDALDWGVLGNNDVGDCVPAGFAHQLRLWQKLAFGKDVRFTDEVVVNTYSKISGYNASVPQTDVGCDLTAASIFWRDTGVTDADGKLHKIDGFVSVGLNADAIAQAVWIFGSCGIGINVPATALAQFAAAKPWDVTDANAEMLGGHYIPAIGRNSAGNILVVTWGRLHAVTPAFLAKYCDEAVVHLSSMDWVRESETPRGVDTERLQKDLIEIQVKGPS